MHLQPVRSQPNQRRLRSRRTAGATRRWSQRWIGCLAVLVALAACSSAPETPRGLGVTREAVQTNMEPLGIVFDPEKRTEEGHLEVWGQAQGNMAFVRLRGPSDDLALATLYIQYETRPALTSEGQLTIALLMRQLLADAAPDWDQSYTWLTEHVGFSFEENYETTHTLSDNRRVVLQHILPLHAIHLAVASGTPDEATGRTPGIEHIPPVAVQGAAHAWWASARVVRPAAIRARRPHARNKRYVGSGPL